jgi:hypothetical protein
LVQDGARVFRIAENAHHDSGCLEFAQRRFDAGQQPCRPLPLVAACLAGGFDLIDLRGREADRSQESLERLGELAAAAIDVVQKVVVPDVEEAAVAGVQSELAEHPQQPPSPEGGVVEHVAHVE